MSWVFGAAVKISDRKIWERPSKGLILAVFAAALLCLATGCNCSRTTLPGKSDPIVPGNTQTTVSKDSQGGVTSSGESFSINLGIHLDKSGDKGGMSTRSMAPRRFLREYEKGVELIAQEKFADAIRVFEGILRDFPNTEEASIAAYAIADIHFRNKANRLALQAFQKVVEEFPNTHAAENAKAGIEYLETFQKHKEEYVSPEIEGRMRRGY